jgi:uncharacterized protein YaiL (DUF2058 family)
MSDSLRDQLLKAGFKATPKPQVKPHSHQPVQHKAALHKPQANKPQREPGELDLAQAFALRAKVERSEHEAAEREAREKAARKKEIKRKLQELIGGNALNRDSAEETRNFEFAGRIRRVYVTRDQLAQLNAGELGVVMHGGRALLVTRELALAAHAISAEAIALLVDPAAPIADDGVPDDLMW